ncbi:MAG: NAD(P)-dependent oxidoreductase [Bacteroidales bacterium]|jgi:nucleoside-diphosphate-sugar epimerase|nr:NAD(P)-dependent oxidoreductase [Bacteroidales bacterium]
MNILLTGATGFIGQHLLKELMLDGENVYALLRPSSEYSDIDESRIFIFDNNIDELQSFLVKHKIEGIVHLASLYLVQHTSEDVKNLILSNVYWGTAVLEAAIKSDVKWFLNVGTYWQNYHSDSENYCPVNLYAATKQAFIDLANYYTEISSLCFVTLKIADTYGHGDNRRKIFNLFKQISETGETLDMSGGQQLMNILHIDDVVRGFTSLIALLKQNQPINSEYVLTAQKCYTLQELAAIFEQVSGKPLHINWGARPYRNREVMEPWQRGEILPNWLPKIDLKTGLSEFIKTC